MTKLCRQHDVVLLIPVLRSEQVGQRKEFDPQAYAVFGPLLIATRGPCGTISL